MNNNEISDIIESYNNKKYDADIAYDKAEKNLQDLHKTFDSLVTRAKIKDGDLPAIRERVSTLEESLNSSQNAVREVEQLNRNIEKQIQKKNKAAQL